MTEQQKDAELIDKVLMKFALSEDNQLEQCLDTFLVPAIAKMSSPYDTTKKKVLELLGHISKRIKTQTNIKLPVNELLNQYNDPQIPVLVKNFNIIYLEMGFSRISVEEKLQFAPLLIVGIASRPLQQQETLLHMFISVAEKLTAPKDDAEIPKKFPFLSSPEDTGVLLDFMLGLLLVPPPYQLQGVEGIIAPPGHSMATLARVMGSKYDRYGSEQLLQRKNGVLDLISTGIFPETSILPHLIVGSVDPHHTVVRKAEDALKKLHKPDMENRKVIDQLFALFAGTSKTSPLPPAQKILPANAQVRAKLFVYFSKSILAANNFPATLQIIFESVYGADTNMKLKQAAMAFVQWVFRQASDTHLQTMGPIILSGLIKLLDQLGEDKSKDANELKSFTYNAIGLLGKRVKTLFASDTQVLSSMLSKMGTEDQRVTSSIYEALSMLREAYANPTPEVASKLEALLLEAIEKPDYQARLAAVQYSNFVYPFSHVLARYADILCVGDSRNDIRDEGKKGLRPYVPRDGDIIPDDSQPYPNFPDLVNYFHAQCKARAATQRPAPGAPEPIGLTAPSYEQMILLFRSTLQHNAKSRNITIKEYINHLYQPDENNPINLYRNLVELGLGSHHGEELHYISSLALLELLTHLTSQLAPLYVPKYAWLKNLLFTGKTEAREVIAKILGIVAQYLPRDQQVEATKGFIQQIADPSVAVQSHYSVACATGFVLGKLLTAPNSSISSEVAEDAINKLYKLLEASNAMLATAGCLAIGVMGRFSPLPIPDSPIAVEQEAEKEKDAKEKEKDAKEKEKDAKEKEKDAKDKEAHQAVTKKSVLNKLISLLQHQERKLAETAALALGYLSLGDPKSSFNDEILVGLFKLAGNKNEELQFTVGEVLSCLGAGESSFAAHDPYSPYTQEEMPATPTVQPKDLPQNGEFLSKIVMQILTDHLTDRRPAIHRCAACIWLMSIVQHTGHLEPVLAKLPLIQVAFSGLLADSNEVTQEVASRGLVLVYEKGDARVKKELVGGLVQTLSTGKAPQGIPGSEQLFPEGALGAAPKEIGGGGMSTYKELCAVATEMGQPDMIYKFLNLASHHALWNTKKGAAFAATTLAEKASDQLKPFLPNLVPKLYRYSYDPNTKVATSMNNILKALIDPKKALDTYFDPIMQELLQGMGSRQWRVREGSCGALGDALQGKSFADISKYFLDIYTMCFRCLDDIKETVRKAAQVALRTLGGLTVRLSDPNYTSTSQAKQTLEIALPFLLDKGITNDAAEVRSFTLNLILKICKSAGPILGPYIPQLVGTLLETLTVLEPQEFNYLSFHTDKLDMSQEQLETTRLAVSKLSPLNDMLDICAKYVTDENAEELVDRLVECVKRGVGMPTRVGVAKFITTMSYTHNKTVAPHSQRLLTALQNAIEDKSPLVRKNFATALANVIKIAAPKNIKLVLGALISKFKETSEESTREAIAVAFKELLRIASTQVRNYDRELVPFLYFAKNDPAESVRGPFKDAWNDVGSGSVRLYLGETIELIKGSMSSASWTTKQQAGQTLSSLANDLGKALAPHANEIVKLLREGLTGKTYKGKEALLGAVSAVSTATSSDLLASPDFDVRALVLSVLAECKKSDKEYKRHAVVCLASVLKTFTHVEVYDEVFAVLQELVVRTEAETHRPAQQMDAQEKQAQEEEDAKARPLALLTRAAAFEALGYAYAAASAETKKNKLVPLCDLLLSQYPLNPWNVQVSLLTSLRAVVKSGSGDGASGGEGKKEGGEGKKEGWGEAEVAKVAEVFFLGLDNAKYSVVRNAALEAFGDLVNVTKDTDLLAPHMEKLSAHLERMSKDNAVQLNVENLQKLLDSHPLRKKAKTG
eukprot:Phypoly_transcript_00236.p1 GENE.Phypoly_transcript_00236~~Phypoly_transcript_00236.p1  ORF type:complete len:1888 (+),score=384.04 Phypoly_transcript_00236:110-5665(+)